MPRPPQPWRELRLVNLEIRFENYSRHDIRCAADQVGTSLVVKIYDERHEEEAPTILTHDSDSFIIPTRGNLNGEG